MIRMIIMVLVQNKDGMPLSPSHPAKARKLRRTAGKAHSFKGGMNCLFRLR